MERVIITIEALNPVNKLKTGTIINTISEMNGISSMNLKFDDQYKFIFSFEHDSDQNEIEIIGNIKFLLSQYSSSVLSIKKESKN